MTSADLESLKAQLRKLDALADDRDDWPAESMRVLGEFGCWREVVPRRFGGDEIGPADLLRVYESVGGGSLTAALVLTQHDRACELIATGENPILADRLLQRVAAGKVLTTVGISQLTTSRRHGGPPLRARPEGNAFRLDGVMPWVTSAVKADTIVTGAVLDDARQILACVPTAAPGVTVEPPMRLMALNRSLTSEVRCAGVRVEPDHVIRGPAEKVLTLRAAIKPSAVAAVGVGVAGAVVEELELAASTQGPELQTVAGVARQRFDALRDRLHRSATAFAEPSAEGASMEFRSEVNDLLARLAASVMVMAKGSGYLASHPAQRRAREALFFMVWSAPQAVQSGTLHALWGEAPGVRPPGSS